MVWCAKLPFWTIWWSYHSQHTSLQRWTYGRQVCIVTLYAEIYQGVCLILFIVSLYESFGMYVEYNYWCLMLLKSSYIIWIVCSIFRPDILYLDRMLWVHNFHFFCNVRYIELAAGHCTLYVLNGVRNSLIGLRSRFLKAICLHFGDFPRRKWKSK